MEWMEVLFSGVGTAVVTAIVTYFVTRRRPPKGKAREVLRKLRKHLRPAGGEYHFARSTDENFVLAGDIYGYSDGETIATAFNENPEKYGEGDLVRRFTSGSKFTRISAEEVCNGASQGRARDSLQKAKRGAVLLVAPAGMSYTRIDGIFCRFGDGTHLAFASFRNPEDASANEGMVFHGELADRFFDYYQRLARELSGKPAEQERRSR